MNWAKLFLACLFLSSCNLQVDGTLSGTGCPVNPLEVTDFSVSVALGQSGQADTTFHWSLPELKDFIIGLAMGCSDLLELKSFEFTAQLKDHQTGEILFSDLVNQDYFHISVQDGLSCNHEYELLIQGKTQNTTLVSGQFVYTPPCPPDLPDPVHVSVAGFSVEEGLTGIAKVILDKPSEDPITIDVQLLSRDAVLNSDFRFSTGTTFPIQFTPGEVVKTIPIQTLEDFLFEADEQFEIKITSASGATILIEQDFALASILNDDPPPHLSISSFQVNEGGLRAYVVVRVVGGMHGPVTFDARTRNGTATQNLDFSPVNYIHCVIPANVNYLLISVPILQDSVDEPNEVFYLEIVNVTGVQSQGLLSTITILDDDPAPTSGGGLLPSSPTPIQSTPITASRFVTTR